MALTATTLATACTASDQSLKVTSATGATVGGFVRVDNEFMKIVSISGTTIGVIRRGMFGGKVVAHNILARLVFGLTSDLVELGTYQLMPIPNWAFDQVNLGANGAIPLPVRDTWYFINKGSALASSAIPDPGVDQDGLRVYFTGITDFAHVVTTVSAHDGTTGLHTTLTSPAFAGGTLGLIAKAGHWYVISNNLWVIS